MDDTLYATLRALLSRFERGKVFSFESTVLPARVQDLRFHDLRHTFASHLVMNGVDIKTVQVLLGHGTLTMTMRYSHLAPDHRTRAINTLDSVLQTDTITDTVENPKANASRQAVVK